MANPQTEDGALVIALELQLAIMRRDFSSLERRVLDAIMRYTYAAGKTKANVTAEDVRLMIEGPTRVRTDRIDSVLVKLTEQHVLVTQPWNDSQLVGIQKNYELWLDKLSMSLKGLNINKYIYTRREADKLSTPDMLVAYSQEKSGFTHLTTTWRVERSWASKLLRKVLVLTNDANQSRELICDYIDENDWMRKNVQRQFAFMYSRFDQWFSQIPRKPREVRDNEDASQRRYRYDVKNKRWLPDGRTTAPKEVTHAGSSRQSEERVLV